jgi:hypothetical protein
MSEIKIVFSPELDIDSAEFMALWNDTPECRKIGQAQLAQQAQTQYIDPSFLAQFVSIEFVTGAILGGMLHDIVKEGISQCVSNIKKGIMALKIKEIKQEDGSSLYKVSPKKNEDSSPESDK